MKTPRTIAAILQYNRLARLVGSGWHHLDRYWESDTDSGREYHRAGVVATIRQFKSLTCGAAGPAPAVEMDLPAGARENATDGTSTRIEEATAALCDCVDFLNRNRPGAARYLLPLILAAAIAVSGVAYAALTVLLLCSDKGLKVSYFKGRQFDKKAMVWTERKVFMDYGGGRPSLFCPADDFSARWEGVLLAPRDDDYSFYAQSIGGLRLVIDDVAVIDDWDEHGWLPGKHGRKRLTAGAHRIRIDYYHARGNAALRLRWSGGGVPPNTVLGGEYLRKR